ncbi:MAG TPA: type II toxin-antitoxin system Phd/YefM family antitoxin [Gemmataceae bacterium]|jgi:prevent-host-death family protein|nr:type II toxin-antitoxin system Phd/YefM family antitoxin [Gemmataceae bacterium]
MSTVTIEEAQAKLTDLIHNLTPGAEVVITENNRPVARLLATKQEPQRQQRQLSSLRGSILYMAPDFDTALDDFREYME